jgi:plastocyanin
MIVMCTSGDITRSVILLMLLTRGMKQCFNAKRVRVISKNQFREFFVESPSSKKKYYIGITFVCLAVIVIIVGLLIWHHSPTAAKTPREAIIDITPNGFVPATLNITSGTVVVWQNQDSATHKIASNPYPLDNSVPGLNSGPILPNGSYQFKPTAGTIHYHDDTKPMLNGTIVVGN